MKNGKMTLEEKQFIVNNCPNVEVTGVEFSCVVAREGDAEGEGDLTGEFSFVTDAAIEAEENDKDWETLRVTFRLRDRGNGAAKLPQKFVSFYGEGQIAPRADELRNYMLTPPEIIFPAMSDPDENRFSFTASICLDETPDGDETLVEKLVKDRATLVFNDVRFGNEYVTEKVQTLIITMADDPKDVTVDFEGISYEIAGEEPENETT